MILPGFHVFASPESPVPDVTAARRTTSSGPPLTMVIALALALAGALLALPLASSAGAVEDVQVDRLSGRDRFETAAALAQAAYPRGTAHAVVATAAAAQDALVGASLAGSLDAALLLVNVDDVPEATADALEDLGTARVTIIGGPLSVSEDVARELSMDGERLVDRIGGETQYDTARLVAEATVDQSPLPLLDGQRTVLLANGESFADAVSGSPLAYAGPTPVLYTPVDALDPDAAAAIEDLEVEQVVILGGTAAISDAVERAVGDLGVRIQRLAGRTRVETSTVVAAWTADRAGFDNDDVIIARGDTFPDSLTASQVAGTALRPVVLAATPEVLPAEAVSYLRDRCGTLVLVQAVGGTAAVSAEVLRQAEAAAEACGAGGTPTGGPPPFTVSPLPLLEADISQVDTISVTDLDGVTSLDVTFFPCAAVEIAADGSAVLRDADGNGLADRPGTSDTGAAIITGINNVNVDDAPVVRDVAPEGDRLGVQVSSGAPDCAAVLITSAAVDGVPVGDDGRPTGVYGATAVRFGDTPPSTEVFRVEPGNPVAGQLGQTVSYVVNGRFDGSPINRSVSLVLFPCNATQITGPGADTFSDADGDLAADGFATTETGGINIVRINGNAIEPDTLEGPITAVDNRITFEVTSDVADCATVMVVAGNGNGQLDVDASGVSTEPYGVGQVRFQ